MIPSTSGSLSTGSRRGEDAAAQPPGWDLSEPAWRWSGVFLLSGVIGVLSGLAAVALDAALDFGAEAAIGRLTDLAGAAVVVPRWPVLLLPAVGGLAAGALVQWFCGGEAIHGTNQVVAVFHNHGGALPLASPAIRALAAVGLISCGGSAGPEGPISALGAGIGSAVGGRLGLPPRLRRVCLIAGCAGGVGAVFQCPLGGALFATGIPYREPEFEAESIVPAFVSSVLSYSTFMAFRGYGRHLILGADRLTFSSPLELGPYALLGILCGGLAILLGACVRLVESRSAARLRLPRWLSAGIGGLIVGTIACLLPQIMDARYRFIQAAISGTLFEEAAAAGRSAWAWAAVFGLVAVAKCAASALTVGTSGAGGLLGPSVFIGGAAGAALGATAEAVFPGMLTPDLRAALTTVGMAGVISASMRAPLAAIVMVTEMTGAYGLIVPLMLVCVVSYVAGKRWGLNDAQLGSSVESPAHAGDALVHALRSWRVRDLMAADWPHVVSPHATLGEMVRSMPAGTRPLFIVVEEGRLLGVVSLTEISRVISEPGISELVIAADIMTSRHPVTRPNDRLYGVLDKFRRTNDNVLPVLAEDGSDRYIGVLARQTIHRRIREHVDRLRTHVHREHEGLAALEQDDQFCQLVLGISAPRADVVQRMTVPAEVAGRSIRQADFRRRYGAQIIAVQQPDGTLRCPPDIDVPLAGDETLLVIRS